MWYEQRVRTEGEEVDNYNLIYIKAVDLFGFMK